jgi:hypothetical protein
MQPECVSPFLFSCDGKLSGAWAYVLTQNVQFRVKGRNFPEMAIMQNGHEIGHVKGEMVTIYAGYAWNGMSCWPDTPTNQLGSVWHDFWYQVGKVVSRKDADLGLRHLLAVKKDGHVGKCYAAVRACGWMFYGKTEGVTLVRI